MAGTSNQSVPEIPIEPRNNIWLVWWKTASFVLCMAKESPWWRKTCIWWISCAWLGVVGCFFDCHHDHYDEVPRYSVAPVISIVMIYIYIYIYIYTLLLNFTDPIWVCLKIGYPYPELSFFSDLPRCPTLVKPLDRLGFGQVICPSPVNNHLIR